MSLPEVLLWVKLRDRQLGGPRIRRQHPVGPFVIDFFCAEARLAIEIDGEAHDRGNQPQIDQQKTAYLESLGIEVLRMPAREVLKDPGKVASNIHHRCIAPPQSSGPADPPPAPPCHGGASI